MTNTFDVERRIKEIAKSYRQLIISADGRALRQLAKERVIGIRTSDLCRAVVCLLQYDKKDGALKDHDFESHIETPIHLLPISDAYGTFSMQGCQGWLDSYGLDDCNIKALGKSFSGAALERRVGNQLFSHPGVIFALKCEMLEELDDLMED